MNTDTDIDTDTDTDTDLYIDAVTATGAAIDTGLKRGGGGG